MPVPGPSVALSGPGFLFKRDAVFFKIILSTGLAHRFVRWF